MHGVFLAGIKRNAGKGRGKGPEAEPPYFWHFFNTIHQEARNTAIANISDLQHSNMPANTDIADFTDISDIWATMGRHMSAGAVPGAEPHYFGHFFGTIHYGARNIATPGISDFQHTNMPANTAIADFADSSDFWATMGRYVGRGGPWGRIADICRPMVAQKLEMSAMSAIA